MTFNGKNWWHVLTPQVEQDGDIALQTEDKMTSLGVAAAKGAQSVVEYFFEVGKTIAWLCHLERTVSRFANWRSVFAFNQKARMYVKENLRFLNFPNQGELHHLVTPMRPFKTRGTLWCHGNCGAANENILFSQWVICHFVRSQSF